MGRRSIAHQRGDGFADTESFSDMRSSLGIFALLAALSCGDSTGPAGAIIGRWETPPRDIGSGYSVVETVNFRSDGTLGGYAWMAWGWPARVITTVGERTTASRTAAKGVAVAEPAPQAKSRDFYFL